MEGGNVFHICRPMDTVLCAAARRQGHVTIGSASPAGLRIANTARKAAGAYISADARASTAAARVGAGTAKAEDVPQLRTPWRQAFNLPRTDRQDDVSIQQQSLYGISTHAYSLSLAAQLPRAARAKRGPAPLAGPAGEAEGVG